MNYVGFDKKRILIFGDSNTFGYNPQNDSRYFDNERYPNVAAKILGTEYTVIEEGLPGRTAVFDDPLAEGLCGLDYIQPCMLSHAPLDTVVIMLGTNDCKQRFGCNAFLLAKGLMRLVLKAKGVDAWRGKPDVLVLCPPPILPAYKTGLFALEMGDECDVKSAQLAKEYQRVSVFCGARFLNAGDIDGVTMHNLDSMHLTVQAHAALGKALAEKLK